MKGGPSHSDRQKASERFEFERFRELCSLVPEGPYEQRDPPCADILVPAQGSFLGVELTSFLLDAGQSDGGSRAMSRDREKERVLEAAKESWNAEGLPPVFVNVTWIERVEVAGSNRTALAEALVRAAKLEIPRPGYRVAREYPSAGWKELQRLGVDRLTVYGLKDPGETGWHSTWSGAIPGFKAGAAEIGRLFLEKEPCVAGYRTYASEIWLLIVAHGRNAVSDFHFYEEDETPSFTTSFDRAFLMSQSRGEFRELRLEVQGNG